MSFRTGILASLALITGTVFIAGCEPQPMSNANLVHVNTNSGNAVNISNSNVNSMLTPGSVVDAAEPAQYQATIKLTLEALGEKGKTTMPAVGARVVWYTQDNGLNSTNSPVTANSITGATIHVPAPASLALLGLGGLVAGRRRR